MNRPIRALIFDFDGVILDTETPDLHCWQEVYAEHGCRLELADYLAGVGGIGLFDAYADLEAQLGVPLDRETLRATRRARYAELVVEQAILPGIESYVADARRLGLRLGVASSSPHEWVGSHLARLGLDRCFDCVTCRDDVARAKPDPDLYLKALDRLGVRADEAIAFEDSHNGVLAATAAGIFCVAVPNPVTRDLPLDRADLRLPSLAELPLASLLDHIQAG